MSDDRKDHESVVQGLNNANSYELAASQEDDTALRHTTKLENENIKNDELRAQLDGPGAAASGRIARAPEQSMQQSPAQLQKKREKEQEAISRTISMMQQRMAELDAQLAALQKAIDANNKVGELLRSGTLDRNNKEHLALLAAAGLDPRLDDAALSEAQRHRAEELHSQKAVVEARRSSLTQSSSSDRAEAERAASASFDIGNEMAEISLDADADAFLVGASSITVAAGFEKSPLSLEKPLCEMFSGVAEPHTPSALDGAAPVVTNKLGADC